MRLRRAFTLVELLTVIAILSILMAVFFPVIMAVKAAAFAYQGSNNLNQLSTAMTMYATEHDETCPPALYWDGAWHGWYGRHLPDGTVDPMQGLMMPYMHNKRLKDPIYRGKAYFGDGSGFGYNWGYIGGDFDQTNDYHNFPMSTNPATMSQVEAPSSTIAFGTSSYYFASWLPNGDNATYDFGFISAPKFWSGNPDVDFRHQGVKKYDHANKQVTSEGRALFSFLDGHGRSMSMNQVKDEMFRRTNPSP